MSLMDPLPKIVEVEVTVRDADGDEWSWRHHPHEGDTLTVATRDEIRWPEPDPFGPPSYQPPPPRGWVLTLGRIGTSDWRVPTSSLPLQSLTVDELATVLDPGAVGW